MEEQGLEKNPDLRLAQTKFSLSLPEHKNDQQMTEQLKSAIIEHSKFSCDCISSFPKADEDLA